MMMTVHLLQTDLQTAISAGLQSESCDQLKVRVAHWITQHCTSCTCFKNNKKLKNKPRSVSLRQTDSTLTLTPSAQHSQPDSKTACDSGAESVLLNASKTSEQKMDVTQPNAEAELGFASLTAVHLAG